MTIEKCLDFCRQNSTFKYVGLETGTQCFCASDYDKIRLIGLEHCSSSCPGNISQICGGSWALSVYEVTPALSASTVTVTNEIVNNDLAKSLGISGFGLSALSFILIITLFRRIKHHTGNWW
jgi:hypothetical protein